MTEVKETINEFNIDLIQEPGDINDIIYSLMVNPNLAPVNYFNDFSEESINPESIGDNLDESGIVDTGNGMLMAMTTHAFHRCLKAEPQKATEILVSRAARRMICSGATPIAVNAFLYHIDVADPFGQFIAAGAKKGLENVAEKFNLKVTGRKIRFDYSSREIPAPSTLIISMAGTVEKKSESLTHAFKSKGNNIFVIGKLYNDIASSEYLEFYHEVLNSPLPAFDIDTEVKIQKVVTGLNKKQMIASASPVSKGGLFFSLLRACIPLGLGFDITTPAEVRKDAFLFGEAMGRIVVGVKRNCENEFVDFLRENNQPFFTLGHVTKGEIRIDDQSFGFINKMTPAV